MSPDVDRPTWDEVHMANAMNMARRSRCCRDQVGAVIVTADNRVNSASYNGPPPYATTGHGAHLFVDNGVEINNFPAAIPDDDSDCSTWCPRAQTTDWHERKRDYSDCYSNHAEANALIRADYSQIVGGTMYVTSTPCVVCAKNMAAATIDRVVYRVDPARPRDPEMADWFMRLGRLRVTRLEG